ncbi:MAG: hypothetical protein R8G66_26530 [Cytophagales bacterium]|nr:hypothetical protein [Cytophagales bacterium]
MSALKTIAKPSTLFVLVMCLLSSCVYSLFPIYTEDTVIFEAALLGTWEDSEGYKITFQRFSDDPSDVFEKKDEENDAQEYALSGAGWHMQSDEPISMEIGGKLVYDTVKISAHMDSLVQGLIVEEKGETEESKVAEEEEKEKSSSARWLLNQTSFDGSVSVSTDKSYRMIVQDNDEESSVYKVHLVKISDNYFIDLYPIIDTKSGFFSANAFPVHTFMKVNFSNNLFELISFDLDKLNDMFVKKLVRLRHEDVDGNILITAQPEQIQKFLEVYSDNEEVYEDPITYGRVPLK